MVGIINDFYLTARNAGEPGMSGRAKNGVSENNIFSGSYGERESEGNLRFIYAGSLLIHESVLTIPVITVA